MFRTAMEDLKSWRENEGRKPLIIRGARQVGKTWLMQEFGRSEFDNTVYINFDREKGFHSLLEGSLAPDRLITAFGAYAGETISPSETLIILDEIQEEPRALSALKYFCEEKPEYTIVAAGSLLGVAMHEGTSFPVGKVNYLDLYPLSFMEFLLADKKKALADILIQGDVNLITGMKESYINLLQDYYLTGGMPEAVTTYVETHDFVKVRNVQESLLNYYRQDFSKHAPATLIPRLNQVWDSIPSQLSKENRKYIYGQVAKGSRAKDFELALQWLSDCGLIHLVHRVTKPGLPLKSYEELSAFKVYLCDTGLLAALGELPISALMKGNLLFEEFKGAMTEQYVLQQIKTELRLPVYYYSAENSRGEIDFLVQDNDRIIPIEVKAAENLQAKSLKAFKDKYGIPLSVRISLSDFRKQDWLVNMPLYAFCPLWRAQLSTTQPF